MMMTYCLKVLVLLTVIVVAYSGYAPGVGSTSDIYQRQDDYGNYNFGYGVHRPYGANNFRQEKGNAYGHVTGSYGLTDADGRKRVVDYIADDHGFRAKVRSNEPGTVAAAAVVPSGHPHPLPYAGPIPVKPVVPSGHPHPLPYAGPIPVKPAPFPGVYSGGFRYISSPYAARGPVDLPYPHKPLYQPYKVASAYPPY